MGQHVIGQRVTGNTIVVAEEVIAHGKQCVLEMLEVQIDVLLELQEFKSYALVPKGRGFCS